MPFRAGPAAYRINASSPLRTWAWTRGGILCLGGFIGRFVGPGQILNSGLDGSFALAIDLGNVPLQFGNGSVQPGETWNFQAWHRDVDGSGTPTSNLTDAVAVTFR